MTASPVIQAAGEFLAERHAARLPLDVMAQSFAPMDAAGLAACPGNHRAIPRQAHPRFLILPPFCASCYSRARLDTVFGFV